MDLRVNTSDDRFIVVVDANGFAGNAMFINTILDSGAGVGGHRAGGKDILVVSRTTQLKGAVRPAIGNVNYGHMERGSASGCTNLIVARRESGEAKMASERARFLPDTTSGDLWTPKVVLIDLRLAHELNSTVSPYCIGRS